MARRTNQQLRLSPEVQCIRALVWLILIVVYTPIIICISLYTTLPTDITCSIESLYVPFLGGATKNHSIYFDLNLSNELTETRVCYDYLNITFHLYDQSKSGMKQIANYTVHKFCQGSSMTTELIDHVDAYADAFGTNFSERKKANKSDFRVNLQTKVRFDYFWKSDRRKLRVGADIEVDKSTGQKVKKEGVILGFSSRDRQHFHLLRLIGRFFWLCLILSLFCFPCFTIVLLKNCIGIKRKRARRPFPKPEVLAQEEGPSLPLVNQISSSFTTGMEQPDNISLCIEIDSTQMGPSKIDAELPKNISPHTAANELKKPNNNLLHTAIGSMMMIDPSTTALEQPSNINPSDSDRDKIEWI